MKMFSTVFKFGIKELQKMLFYHPATELRCNWVTAIVWAGNDETYLHYDVDPMISEGKVIGSWGGIPIIVDNSVPTGRVDMNTKKKCCGDCINFGGDPKVYTPGCRYNESDPDTCGHYKKISHTWERIEDKISSTGDPVYKCPNCGGDVHAYIAWLPSHDICENCGMKLCYPEVKMK